MTLLYILALILLCIALNQLFRVFELSRDLRGEELYKVNDNDNKFNGRAMLLFMVVFFGFFIVSVVVFFRLILLICKEPAYSPSKHLKKKKRASF